MSDAVWLTVGDHGIADLGWVPGTDADALQEAVTTVVEEALSSGVRRVQVWIEKGEEAAGRLVARNFGPKVKVVTVKGEDLADGVDVIVANKFPEKLGKKVESVKVREPLEICE